VAPRAGRWHAPDGEFTYLEFNLDQLSYLLAKDPVDGTRRDGGIPSTSQASS
jgi:hypothetical protein